MRKDRNDVVMHLGEIDRDEIPYGELFPTLARRFALRKIEAEDVMEFLGTSRNHAGKVLDRMVAAGFAVKEEIGVYFVPRMKK